MVILRYAFDGEPPVFARIAPPLIGLLPFITMFIVTSIAMLRERTSGTLERLMSMPVGKLDLLAGYALAFGAVAVVADRRARGRRRSAPSALDAERTAALLVALAVANALLGMSLGLLASAFATSEFQAVQFMPAVVLPQLLLCGLFVARDRMAGAARGHLGRAAADLRLRRAGTGRRAGAARRAIRRGRRGGGRRDGRGARARRRVDAAPLGVTR